MNVILGQGIAGTILAFRLLEKGEEVVIIDDGHRSSSSKVAAGLWNPIVFRRINKSWMADEFISELESFYPSLEKKLRSSFYQELSVERIHSSRQEREAWFEKKNLPGFSKYLSNDESEWSSLVSNPSFGVGQVRHAGYLDLPGFLSAAAEFFSDEGSLRIKILDEDRENNSPKEIFPGAKRIIDCRGYKSAYSPWWKYLPFGLTKGEVLTIRCEGIQLDQVFNAGFFLLPLGDNLYRLGATFNWKDQDAVPTEEAKVELLKKLRAYYHGPVEILGHQAGVRPTVQDRRPLLGKHPSEEGLFIFNGMGTKGVMLAPFLSKNFCNWILDGSELIPEADIQRFQKYYGSENPRINYPVA